MPANRFDRTAYDADLGAEARDDSSDDDAAGLENGPEALRRLQFQLEALGEYARLYAAAKRDTAMAALRTMALWGAAAVAVGTIAVALLVTAAVLTLIGMAEGIGLALGGHLWAGYLLVGGGLLLMVALSLTLGIRMLQRRFRKETIDRYAKRHEAQPIHSRNASQRAARTGKPAGDRTAERN